MSNEVTKTSQSLSHIDPFKESIGCLILVAFPKSTSKNYPIAVSIAQGANRYGIADINGKPMNFAVFAKTQDDAGRALALMDYASNWKGTLIFSGGRVIQNGWSIAQVINCHLEAVACSDHRAHCQNIIDDPFSEQTQSYGLSLSISLVDRPSFKQKIEIDRYAFPCQLLRSYFRFQKDHPSTPESQIEAAGISRCCHICPYFDPSEFKVVGVK